MTNFNPLIIAGYGFSRTKTVLMATPQAAVAMVSGAVLTAMLGGTFLALGTAIPISPYVTTLSFVIYLVARVVGRPDRRREVAPSEGGAVGVGTA